MSKLLSKALQWHCQFFTLVSYLQSPFLLLVRLYWGWQLAQSGWGKLHHLSNVGEYFATLGLPMPAQMAVFIACVEFFGGIFLALGLTSRITGLVLTVNLTMAYVIGDREALLSFLSDPDKFVAAAPFAFLVVALVALIFGAGRNFCRASGWIDLLGALDATRAHGHAQFRRTNPCRGVANGPRVTSASQQTPVFEG